MSYGNTVKSSFILLKIINLFGKYWFTLWNPCSDNTAMIAFGGSPFTQFTVYNADAIKRTE